MSWYFSEISGFSKVLLGVIAIGFALMVIGAILFISNCADWTGRACTDQIGWIPQPLVDIPLTLIGFGLFFGGIGTLIMYNHSRPA